jgi:hypothetical protein
MNQPKPPKQKNLNQKINKLPQRQFPLDQSATWALWSFCPTKLEKARKRNPLKYLSRVALLAKSRTKTDVSD